MNLTRVRMGACVVVIGLLGCAGPEPGPADEQQPDSDRAALLRSLPQVTELPSNYRSVGELADRGMFYVAGERPSFRIDDGNHYHGYDGPGVWAQEPTGTRTQGVLYGVEDGAIVSAGYLIRQADLAVGKSFHGLTLRELGFPAAHSMTVDLVEGETADANQYLWLWHFLPHHGEVQPMLPVGQLPAVTSLPSGYTVVACDHIPETRFCPGMGRHFIDLPPTVTDPTFSRQPTAAGDDGVIYGEAAGKLIFIEYVFSQEDLATGTSWPAIPLSGLPIPPIDNVHVLHFGTDAPGGRYTVHMYFIPEETYLGWDSEPAAL
ncbi:MAG: hypothetical protein V3T48_06105 [Vicinamibacterales bacterium]